MRIGDWCSLKWLISGLAHRKESEGGPKTLRPGVAKERDVEVDKAG